MKRHLSHRLRWPAVLSAAALVISAWSPGTSGGERPTFNDQIDALNQLERLVHREYYTETDPIELYDGAIQGYLSSLDPHSSYITAEELQLTQERLQGTFEGIGIYFSVQDGFLKVMSPIEGSPAYDVGLLAGDRIVRIDGRSAIGIKESEVTDRLKGPKGSIVGVTVQREGEDEPIEFDIVRDRVHVPSVPYHFLLAPKAPDVGYVKVNRFSQRTSKELAGALTGLRDRGAAKILLDLRGNGGGFLEQAVQVANLLLEQKRLVVYTEGRHPSSRENHYASRDPLIPPSVPVIILVDSYSASASEIVAGAIQDYDRGLIVGHTTFGKGLVQKQFPLKNGGSVLLTVARYFTPSDRPIQRPFSDDREAYMMEAHDDYDPNADPDSLDAKAAFYTEILGRKVYSSGGITPDVTLPPDSAQAIPTGLRRSHFFDFAAEVAAATAVDHPTLDAFLSYRAGTSEVDDFREFLKRQEIAVDEDEFDQAADWIAQEVTRNIAQIRWGFRGRGRIDVQFDPQVNRAAALFEDASQLLASRELHYNRGRRTHVPSGETAEQMR